MTWVNEERIELSTESEKALRDKGTILLCGSIDTDAVKGAAIDLLDVDNKAEAAYDHINLIINSPGGSCWDGFMLIDIMELCKLPIHVTGLGGCCSMGFMILCAGAKGHRKITENTTLMCHQFSWWGAGKNHELVSRRKHEDYLNERLINHLIKNTKLDKKGVEKLLMPESDVWLLPHEALKYGIVDEIIKTDTKKRKK